MNDFPLKINGRDVPVRASGEETLLSVLRDRIHLTGTKYGCGEGQCGACTVLIDGVAMRSCQARLAASTGVSITTIEGLERGGLLSPVQQAFLDEGAFQCGYCTSGMILSATALLQDHPRPTDAQIVSYMDGNMCRCGTYPRIAADNRSRIAASGSGEKGASDNAHK